MNARPFAVLNTDTQVFQGKLDEGIDNCRKFLDDQMIGLFLDREALNELGSSYPNAFTEFSGMKSRLLMQVKSHFEKMEAEWQKNIQKMKKMYIKNVQRLLAKTKLEGKLPSSEFKPLSNNFL